MNDQKDAGRSRVPVPVVSVAREARTVATPPPRPPPPRGLPWGLIAAGVVLLILVAGGATTYAVLSARGTPAAEVTPAPREPEPTQPPPVAPVEVPAPPPVAVVAIPAPAVDEPARACPDHSGHWSGSWGAITQRGTWAGDFTEVVGEDGITLLHGDIRVVGTSCGTGGHIVGRVLEDCSVAFDPYSTGGCRVQYAATFEGETMQGTMIAFAFGMSDRGSWQGTRRASAEPAVAPPAP